MKFIILNEDELTTLKMMSSHHPNSFVRERAQSLIMNHNGIRVNQISDIFSVQIRAVYSWIKSVKETTCFINEHLSEGVTERMLKVFLKKRLCLEKNKMLAQTSSKSRGISVESRAIEGFTELSER